jgi:hypothetical protein
VSARAAALHMRVIVMDATIAAESACRCGVQVPRTSRGCSTRLAFRVGEPDRPIPQNRHAFRAGVFVEEHPEAPSVLPEKAHAADGESHQGDRQQPLRDRHAGDRE